MADLFTENELVVLYNEWQRRFLEDPELFDREFQVAEEYKNDVKHKRVPNYSRDCVDYLLWLRTAKG